MNEFKTWTKRSDRYTAYGNGYRWSVRLSRRFGPGFTDKDFDFREILTKGVLDAKMILSEWIDNGYRGYVAEILPGGWHRLEYNPLDMRVAIKEPG